MDQKFKSIAKLFQKLPGVGPRQAARFVLALLDKPESELEELGDAVKNLKKEIAHCQQCFNISEGPLCAVCSNPSRDKSKLMVVEKVTDLDSIEKTGLYKGLYHVLGRAINPLEGVTPEKLHMKELKKRVQSLTETGKPLEVIIATNPTTTGETTALYVRDLLASIPGVTITHLARGLASGSNLEYADEATLKNALEYRK